ncbi:MAG: RagB/SusD family nutrient uptake outer membrane protein [Bacteroidales bacterium]|nr:RagB/SusD family nutrient uptake outer membrane protein [Bacteroidales bacterium]
MNTKSIFKIILISFIGLSFSGCSDYLNLLPEDDLVSAEYWKSQDDVEAVIASTYGVLTSQVKTLLFWGELRGGLFSEGTTTPNDQALVMAGKIEPTNSLTSWAGMYKIINGANQVLKFAPQVIDRDPSFTSAELRQVLSEAYFLRSLAYFYLIRTFKDVPLLTEPFISDDQDYYPPKNSEKEILDQIISDLSFAVDNAAESYDDEASNKGRVTVYSVHALLADVYLWMDNYDKAIENCDAIINSPKFALMSSSNWFSNFYPGNSNSSIFEIQFSADWGYSAGLFETFSHAKNYDFIVNPRIAILYELDDVRGLGGSIGKTNQEVWKYVGINDEEERLDANKYNNYIIYRLADIILLKAEAEAELSNFTSSLDLINSIRLKRNVPEATIEPSVTAFENYILEERARELVGEGKYWFDLIRIGQRENYKRKDLVIENLVLNATAAEAPGLRVKFQDPYSWYLPINKSELDINSNLVQNPYYQ